MLLCVLNIVRYDQYVCQRLLKCAIGMVPHIHWPDGTKSTQYPNKDLSASAPHDALQPCVA